MNTYTIVSLSTIKRVLQYTYAGACFIVGIDKFLYLATNWAQYVNPVINIMLGINVTHLLYLVGIVEIAAAILVLWKPRYGGYLVAAWLGIIIINLATLYTFYDIILRDAVMAVGAWALAELSDPRRGI